jgi:hypothetical protein
MTKECPECKGKGIKPLPFLGSPDDPCPVCGGSGTIEVVEEPLTAWQEEVVTLLRAILAAVVPPPARRDPPADLKPIDYSVEVGR